MQIAKDAEIEVKIRRRFQACKRGTRDVIFALKDQITVSHDQATSGGTERPANVVAPRDIERLEAQLVDRLTAQALSQLRGQRGDGEIGIEPTVVVSVTEKVCASASA